MKQLVLLFLVFTFQCSLRAQTKTVADTQMLFRDPSKPLDIRIKDLISRMTIEEKASQLYYRAVAIERLGVPAFTWWNQCMNGVMSKRPATLFPVPIAMAATWDTCLIFKVANVSIANIIPIIQKYISLI